MEISDEKMEFLCNEAENIVQKLQNKLPGPLREKAKNVDCFLGKSSPRQDCIIYGLCPQILGMEGGSIVIYVGTIYEKCCRDKENFAQWIENVYLHELGHILGCNEDELRQRGL